MLILRILFLSLFLFSVSASAQVDKSAQWNKWSWLIGHWHGEENKDRGGNDGMFSLLPDLDNHVLIRKNHTEYTTRSGDRAIHHDLLVVYPDTSAEAAKAIYFDNEGHVINYKVSFDGDKSIVLVSEKMDNAPVFRLIYTLVDEDKVNIKFEMSRDGETFSTYMEGNCLRDR